MKNVKRALALLLTAGMVASLAACGGGKSSAGADANTSAAGETTSAASGSNTLNVHIETEVQSLDPQIATDGTSFEVIADFTDGLYQMDEDGNPVLALAAEEPEISEDGLHYTFKLRQDAKWSNGESVTANDFVFAWRRAINPDTASEYAFMISDVAQIKNASAIAAGEMDVTELGVVATDDYTLDIDLEAPVSYFKALMYFPTFYPVNEAFFNTCPDTFGTSPETVLANGAFIVTEYEPAATSFKLVKNPDYYDADRISLDGLNYQVIKDNQQALLSYQSGDLDIITVTGEQVEQIQDDPEFQTVNAGYLWYLSPNIKAGIGLENENLRKAINAAFDREACVKNVVKDGSAAATFGVPDGLAVGPDGKDFRETAVEFEGSDPEKALEYFEAAKKELGKDTFEFTMINDDDETATNVAAFLKEQIETTLPGVTITLKTEPKKQRVEDMQNGNFEIALTRWGPDYADPMTYLGMWYTDNANNYGFWSNAEYDALLDASTTGDLATDPEGRWDALHQAEEIMMSEAVIFPVYEKANAVMVKSNVSGIEFHPVALNRVYKDTVKQ